eukprot:g20268.t1
MFIEQLRLRGLIEMLEHRTPDKEWESKETREWVQKLHVDYEQCSSVQLPDSNSLFVKTYSASHLRIQVARFTSVVFEASACSIIFSAFSVSLGHMYPAFRQSSNCSHLGVVVSYPEVPLVRLLLHRIPKVGAKGV